MLRFDEGLFRSAEQILDTLLQGSDDALREESIQVTDLSTREMHYKAEALQWVHRFEKSQPSEYEMARTTVHLLFSPPIPPSQDCVIEKHWKAELFQPGQESRLSKKGMESVALSDLESDGLSHYILEALQFGFDWLADQD